MLARSSHSLRLRKWESLSIAISSRTIRAWSTKSSPTNPTVCWSCMERLARRRMPIAPLTPNHALSQRRHLSNTPQSTNVASEQHASQQAQNQEYFSPNKLHHIPLDASSQLSKLSTRQPDRSLRQKFFLYLSLSKPRLTFLTVLTTTTAYSLFPVAITPLATSMTLSPLTLLNLCAGTALSSACANALNMYLEPAYDAQMSRTRSRPLVRGLLSSRAALIFAFLTGAAGVGLLYTGVNPTVSFLSALNIVLYAGIYTPLKRISVINTWVGAIVGGIPPLMGWAAGAGDAAIRSGRGADVGWQELLFDPETSVGGWLLAGLLFAWQFPHFYAIAYSIRHEYAAAGYKMLSSVNVRKSAIISLRYSLAMVPLCAGLSFVGVTSWTFIASSSAVNAWMIREAWRFLKFEGAKGSARGLFWASVWHLPLVLVLAMAQKKGLWERLMQGGLDSDELYAYAHGQQPGYEDDEDEDDVEDDANQVVLPDRIV